MRMFGKLGVMFLIILFIGGMSGYTYYSQTYCSPTYATVTTSAETYTVVYADSYFELQRGLSESTRPLSVDGLLLVFPKEKQHSITMKSMSYPLTLLSVSNEGVVLDVKKAVQPGAVVNMTGKYVLELPPSTKGSVFLGQTVNITTVEEERQGRGNVYKAVCL